MLKINRLLAFLLICGSFNSLAGQLIDPTKPAQIVAALTQNSEKGIAEKPSFVLKAISISAKKRIAFINDQQYKVGQRLGAAKIVKISSNKVTLSSGKELILFDQSIVSLSRKD
ncbi:MAG: hypothetical protein HRU25_09200 [Psychrobium sp.]|nr:hypothetical protein [Psychrobium sp.]